MNEWIAMSLLAALLLLVAGYYARKAIVTLRSTTPAFEMLPDERRFLRRQAWRRLVNSSLMLVLAGFLVSAYASGMQRRADELGALRERQQVDGQKPPLTDEQHRFSQIFLWYWIAMLAMLFAVVALAGLDLYATRRYALAQLRRIQTDRRAMMERNLARLREEREDTEDE